MGTASRRPERAQKRAKQRKAPVESSAVQKNTLPDPMEHMGSLKHLRDGKKSQMTLKALSRRRKADKMRLSQAKDNPMSDDEPEAEDDMICDQEDLAKSIVVFDQNRHAQKRHYDWVERKAARHADRTPRLWPLSQSMESVRSAGPDSPTFEASFVNGNIDDDEKEQENEKFLAWTGPVSIAVRELESGNKRRFLESGRKTPPKTRKSTSQASKKVNGVQAGSESPFNQKTPFLKKLAQFPFTFGCAPTITSASRRLLLRLTKPMTNVPYLYGAIDHFEEQLRVKQFIDEIPTWMWHDVQPIMRARQANLAEVVGWVACHLHEAQRAIWGRTLHEEAADSQRKCIFRWVYGSSFLHEGAVRIHDDDKTMILGRKINVFLSRLYKLGFDLIKYEAQTAPERITDGFGLPFTHRDVACVRDAHRAERNARVSRLEKKYASDRSLWFPQYPDAEMMVRAKDLDPNRRSPGQSVDSGATQPATIMTNSGDPFGTVASHSVPSLINDAPAFGPTSVPHHTGLGISPSNMSQNDPSGPQVTMESQHHNVGHANGGSAAGGPFSRSGVNGSSMWQAQQTQSLQRTANQPQNPPEKRSPSSTEPSLCDPEAALQQAKCLQPTGASPFSGVKDASHQIKPQQKSLLASQSSGPTPFPLNVPVGQSAQKAMTQGTAKSIPSQQQLTAQPFASSVGTLAETTKHLSSAAKSTQKAPEAKLRHSTESRDMPQQLTAQPSAFNVGALQETTKHLSSAAKATREAPQAKSQPLPPPKPQPALPQQIQPAPPQQLQPAPPQQLEQAPPRKTETASQKQITPGSGGMSSHPPSSNPSKATGKLAAQDTQKLLQQYLRPSSDESPAQPDPFFTLQRHVQTLSLESQDAQASNASAATDIDEDLSLFIKNVADEVIAASASTSPYIDDAAPAAEEPAEAITPADKHGVIQTFSAAQVQWLWEHLEDAAAEEHENEAKTYERETDKPASVAVGKIGRFVVRKKDMDTLLPEDGGLGWLNDDIVNAFLSAVVLYEHHRRELPAPATVGATPIAHAFNSAWASDLSKGAERLRLWGRKAKLDGEKILGCEKIFLPICSNSHWTLFVVSPMHRRIEYLDSMNQVRVPGLALAQIQAWLKGELGNAYGEDEWPITVGRSVQQQNGSDCGVFVCIHAIGSIQDIPPYIAIPHTLMNLDLGRIYIAWVLANDGFRMDYAW